MLNIITFKQILQTEGWLNTPSPTLSKVERSKETKNVEEGKQEEEATSTQEEEQEKEKEETLAPIAEAISTPTQEHTPLQEEEKPKQEEEVEIAHKVVDEPLLIPFEKGAIESSPLTPSPWDNQRQSSGRVPNRKIGR